MVQDEKIEEMLVHAVLAAWNISLPFYSGIPTHSWISLLGEAFPDPANGIRPPMYVYHTLSFIAFVTVVV